MHEHEHSVISKKSILSPEYFLPLSVILSGIMISGAILYAAMAGGGAFGYDSGKEEEVAGAPSAAAPKINKDDIVLGDPKAPVTMFEYGDYSCGYCKKFAQGAAPVLREKYVNSGKMKIVFRNFQFLSPESNNAANAAACAAEQGRFWAYHDELYKAPELNESAYTQIAMSVGLDVDKFSDCYSKKPYAAKIEKDRTDGSSYGVNSTPTSFINGQKITGALPAEEFSKIIDAELAKK